LFWNGRVEGYEIPEAVNVFPVAVPIATQLPHAAGAAWAAKLRGVDQVAVALFGDGASSEGDFHTAMNFAGVFHVPAVFVCQNNQYAISVPYRRQTASETIAQKADAYGFEGIRIDGCDVIAVYRAVQAAIEKAAAGGGPTLVEALTYRYGAHTTSDDPTKYRKPEEVEEWRARDPIAKLGGQLREWGLWDDEAEEQLQQEADSQVSTAIAAMESIEPVNPDDLFLHIYETPTPRLLKQRDALRAELAAKAQGGIAPWRS
jgi:pyruvate dehydrogenase E1 component alpha subunit